MFDFFNSSGWRRPISRMRDCTWLARVPAPGYGAYCAAKAAVRAAATQLRRELRNDGIMVSYVDPGAVDTEFSQASGISRNERSSTHTPPQRVARAILDGLEQRRAIVNAQPLQSFAVALGERFPRLADFAFERFAERPRAAPLHIAPADPLPTPREESDELSTVLGPLARRMERVKLPTSFVRRLLVDEATIDLNETAMRWAGMPNKNERAALSEVFGALVVGGYLAQLDEQHFRVLRAAETLDGDGEKE